MDNNALVAAVDAEIATLREVKQLLSGDGHRRELKPGSGAAFPFGNKQRKKRTMSAKAKDAIRDAQKARWAKWHKEKAAAAKRSA